MSDKKFKLTPEECERYSRQMLVKEWMGEKGQLALSRSKVLVVGAGGSGSSLLYYLAAAGVGEIVICDGDDVDLSNLNRQILHASDRIGMNKAASAGETLAALNPCVKIHAHATRLKSDNIEKLAAGCDLICCAADNSDNGETYRVIEEYAFSERVPISWGGGYYTGGFLTFIEPGVSPCISCFMEHFDKSNEELRQGRVALPDNAAIHDEGPNPIVGAAAGMAGSMQALEVIKHLVGFGTGLSDKLLIFQFRVGANFTMYDSSEFRRRGCKLCDTNSPF